MGDYTYTNTHTHTHIDTNKPTHFIQSNRYGILIPTEVDLGRTPHTNKST